MVPSLLVWSFLLLSMVHADADADGASSAAVNESGSLESWLVRCKTDLQWKDPDIRKKCTEVTGWKPQSILWDQYLNRISPLLADPYEEEQSEDEQDDQYDRIASCLDDSLDAFRVLSELNVINPTSSNSKRTPRIPTIIDQHLEKVTDRVLLVEIANAIDDKDADAIKALAGCVRQHVGNNNFDARVFASGGGNDCTYVHMMLQLFLPGLAARIQKVGELAYHNVGWAQNVTLKEPARLGLRTSEHLSYGTFLDGLGSHGDTGSVYTVIFALTDPSHYGGGEFYLHLGEENYEQELVKYHFKPDKYSAFVFLSETPHGVEPIKFGHREMFTNEFWPHYDVPYPENRPNEDLFEVYCWKIDQNGGDVFGTVYPDDQETEAWLNERNRTWSEERYSPNNEDEEEDEEDGLDEYSGDEDEEDTTEGAEL